MAFSVKKKWKIRTGLIEDGYAEVETAANVLVKKDYVLKNVEGGIR